MKVPGATDTRSKLSSLAILPMLACSRKCLTGSRRPEQSNWAHQKKIERKEQAYQFASSNRHLMSVGATKSTPHGACGVEVDRCVRNGKRLFCCCTRDQLCEAVQRAAELRPREPVGGQRGHVGHVGNQALVCQVLDPNGH